MSNAESLENKSAKPAKRYRPSRPMESVLEAIKGSAGIRATIAKRLDVTWKTAESLCDRWPETQEAYQCEREAILDMSETTILTAIRQGDVGAAKWILSMLGKDRGFGDKLEITGHDEGPIQVEIKYVD